jgi:epoxyqueuosine reductase QueG
VACQFPADQLDAAGDAYTIARDNMREKMNQIAVRLAAWLNSRGMKSQEVLAAGRITMEADGRFRDQLSLKHAGMHAGLGKIGKNSLLINERYGNMIWISGVLTTTSLVYDPPADYVACLPDCRRCVQACKVNAFEDQVVQQKVCYSHAFRKVDDREDGKTEIIVCNTCRVVCPHAFGIHRS